MHESHKIEGIVTHLSDANLDVNDIVRALGKKLSEQGGAVVVDIGRGPFDSAKVSEFRGKINLRIVLAADSLRLSDITDDPHAWRVAPRLPDTGQQEIYRDWHTNQKAIRCIARVEGDGELADRSIQSLRCQMLPL